MSLPRTRAERDPRPALGRQLGLDTSDELADVGGREHVRVRTNLLDHLDLGRDSVDCEVERLHIVPLAAVTDVGLVVLGGGIGANGDLLYEGVETRLQDWLPSPPRVEASSLGDAAVLTGGLAIGLLSARENVVVNRARS